MSGLQKSKAKSGETSQSARGINLEDIQKLYFRCIADPSLSSPDRRWGVVRYVSLILIVAVYFSSDVSLDNLPLGVAAHASHR